MIHAFPTPNAPPRPDTPPAFEPKPVHGDASFGRLLSHQRKVHNEHRQSLGLDEGDAQLLPLMLSLARISARVEFMSQNSGGSR